MDREASLRTFPEQSEAGWKWLPYALLLAVTFALYGATLYFDFVWDDILYIHRNYRIHRLDLPHLYAFWTGTYLGHYAPVQHTFLALLYHFFGIEPFGYHLAQVLVHAASACLLFFVLQKMEMPRVAWVASLLFAVHPTSIETVAWVSETKSTLAFFFFLLSFWFFIRLRERERPREQWTDGVLAGLFLILSVLSKINTVVAPAIFLLYYYRQGASFRTLRWRSLGCFFLISAAFTAIHLGAFHGSPQRLEGVYYGGPGVHLMNLPLLLSFYVRMAVFPYPVSAWEMFPAQEQLNWLVALGWAGLLAVALLLLRTSRSTQFWALWFVVFLLPVLQIVPFPIWVADRYLYIPGIGLFVLVGRLFSHAWDRAVSPGLRWSLQCAMVAAIVVLGWRTLDHLPAWRNDLALWEATAPTCQTSAYCHLNLGLALLQNGYTERGVKELIRAVELRSTPLFLSRLGDAFTLSVGDYRQAAIAYTMALEQEGTDPHTELYAKLARARLLEGRPEEARRVIEAGQKVNPNDPALWIVNAVLEWKSGNGEGARLWLGRALAMAGNTPDTAGFILQTWPFPQDVRRLLSGSPSSEATHR